MPLPWRCSGGWGGGCVAARPGRLGLPVLGLQAGGTGSRPQHLGRGAPGHGLARQQQGLRRKCARTWSRSCSTATTVRPSPCQRCSRASRSAVVRASMALKGSSSRISPASCSSRRANSTRWNWPDDSSPMARRSTPARPTAANAACAWARCAAVSRRARRPAGPSGPASPCHAHVHRESCGRCRTAAAGRPCVAVQARALDAAGAGRDAPPISPPSSVLLPAPLGPTMAVRLPRQTGR
jgi:hypothetical protein